MTKAEIVAQIAEKTGIEKGAVQNVVENFMEVVKASMAKGENVYLRGFGSFIIKTRAEKTGRNISKNVAITIPAHKNPVAPVVFHVLDVVGKASDLARLKEMEETQLRLEDGVDKDEVFASDADAFDDLHLLFLQQLAVDEFDVQADLAQQVDRLGHQLFKDAVEQDVGVAEIHFLSVLDALLVFLEEL